MDKFLEKHHLPKLNQKEAKSLNRMIATSKIEAIIKKLQAHKSPGPYGFTGKFYQTFKEELSLSLLIIPKNSRRGKTPKLFMRPSIILIPKPGKDITKKENDRPIFLMNIYAKIFNKNIGNPDPAIH